jgi:hypothetical protein
MGSVKNRKGKNSERELAAKNSDMKINYQSSNDACRLKSRFVIVSIFETDSFPVRVQNLRLARSQRQGKINPIDVLSKSLDTARRISTFL